MQLYKVNPSPGSLSPTLEIDATISNPELGDVLPDLALRGIPVHLVPVGLGEKCEDCLQAHREQPDHRVNDAAVWVCWRAPHSRPDARVYRRPSCVEHLWPGLIYEIRRGSRVSVEVPTAVTA